MMIPISEVYGIGGFDPSVAFDNVVERTVAISTDDGWVVVTLTGSGEPVAQRSATPDEAAAFNERNTNE